MFGSVKRIASGRHVLVALFTAMLLLPAISGSAVAQSWTKTKVVDCTSHNGGKEFRCLSDASLEKPTQTFSIYNHTSNPIQFNYHEWHSACGYAGSHLQNEVREVAPGKTDSYSLLSAGTGATCREIYVRECMQKNNDGSMTTRNCDQVLLVKLHAWKGNVEN